MCCEWSRFDRRDSVIENDTSRTNFFINFFELYVRFSELNIEFSDFFLFHIILKLYIYIFDDK